MRLCRRHCRHRVLALSRLGQGDQKVGDHLAHMLRSRDRLGFAYFHQVDTPLSHQGRGSDQDRSYQRQPHRHRLSRAL